MTSVAPKGFRILLIDDSAVARDAASAALEAAGYDVVCIDSHEGFGFPSLIDREQPGLVLVDVMMPAFRGGDLVVRAKRECRHRCPILLYSGMATDEELRTEMERSGADGVIPKTGDLRRLVRDVERFLVPGRTASTPQLNDSSKLDLLAELGAVTGRKNFVRNIVDSFLQDVNVRVDAIKKARFAGDSQRLREHAHALKGSAAQLGATVLADRSGRLQTLAGHPDSHEVVTLVNEIEEEAELAVHWVQRELQRF